MAKKKSHTFRVNIDMKWSKDIVVTARTASEARKKAWKRYKPTRADHELLADKED